MNRRPLLAALVSAVLAVPITMGAAHAAPPPEPPAPPGLPVVSGRDVARPSGEVEKVSPSLAGASGRVTAFVQLDAPSRLDVTEAGGDAAEVDAAAAQVEALAEEVVPEVNARSSVAPPETLSVTSSLVAGMVVAGDAARVRALAAQDSVVAVYLVVPKTPANKGSDEFTRALDAWASAGATGDGVTIGVIDTGVDYTHADFGGPGTADAYAAAYGSDGTGPVPPDLLDPAKYLGGYDFAGPTYDADPASLIPGASDVPQPDGNPIDSPDGVGGHGTHVAGTAAGYGVQADGTTFTGDYSTLTDLSDWQIGPGTAPEAGIYALKVFGDQGGSTGLVIDALEWAADPNDDGDLNDHLDILNLSLGSDASPADDPENLFVDRLTRLGVLSVIASGNAGDTTDIGGSPGNARSALTVANSVSSTQTYDAVEVLAAPDPSLVGLHAAQNSVNYAGTDDVTAAVSYPGADVTGCASLAAHSAQITGTIVFLSWDDNDSTRACGSALRYNNAEAAGAVGVLFGTELPVFSAGIAGNAGIPGAQLTAASTDALEPQIAAGGVQVRIGPSLANAAFTTSPVLGDTLNDGSSRGVHGSLGILKPDVAAPGTLISSASSGTGADRSTKSGTSMATPHVAGIAALVAGTHPGWDAQQVKAAVMNTATHEVYSELGQTGPVYGPERVGAGRVDALDAATNDVIAYATDDRDLVSVTFGVVPVGGETVVEERSVSIRNDSGDPRTYATSFDQATSTGGATITTNPTSLTIPAGGTGLVTLTLTADPTTLAKDLDPTMDPTYDLGIPVPRDYLATLSGRLVLTPSGGGELLVPVQAAPRLVSDLSAEPVQLASAAATSAPLTLTGRGVDQGGWTSLVAPFVLVAESPQLEDDASVGTSDSSIAAADLRYVGFASTAPQLVAAGADPAVSGHGTIGIGIATQGEWATLGTNVIPVIDTDIDGDGIWDLETIIWKYGPELDFTTVETYALEYADGSYALGDLLDLSPVNGVWADVDTTVFDNNVVVAPINLDAVGIEPGDVPTFGVSTASPYATGGGSLVDEVDVFTADPFAPAFWFDAGPASADSLWFLGAPGTPFTVNRSAGTGDGRLLLLHSHNATGQRAEVVDVTAPVATATTTGLVVGGPLTEGSQQHLTATVAPAEATGTVQFLDGGTELGTAPVQGGVAGLDVQLAVGQHSLTAVYVPDVVAFTGSTSAPVVVDITARQASTLWAAVPSTIRYGSTAPVVVVVRTAGATPTGTVEVREGDTLLASGSVLAHGRTGAAVVLLPRTLALGSHHLTITYSGNAEVAPSTADKHVTVVGWGRIRR